MMARFSRYVEKVFHFSDQVAQLRDSRKKPQIPTPAVFLSAMMMFVTRLGSLNALEGGLRFPGRWEKIVGKKPGVDTVARVVDQMDSGSLRGMISWILSKLRRNKALDDNPWALRIAAFDGHEFFSLKKALLRPVLPEGDHHQEEKRRREKGDGVLPPRRRRSSGGLRNPRGSRHRNDCSRRRRNRRGQAPA